MSRNKFCESEEKRLGRIQNFQLPPSFKKIGLGVVIFAFLALFLKKVSGMEIAYASMALKTTLIIGLLLISISKDEDEDELIVQLRAQSYTLAFITTVIYALATPIINTMVDNIVTQTQNANNSLPHFQVLFFMLGMQIMFFHFFKKMR